MHYFEVADINNDNLQDLIISTSSGLEIMNGIGQGLFGNPRNVYNEEFFYYFELIDINCDNELDIAFTINKSFHSNKILKVLVQNDDSFDEYSLELERYIKLIDFVDCNEGNDAELILKDDSDKLYAIKFEEQEGLSTTILSDDLPKRLGKQIFISENKQPYYIEVNESDLNENEYILRLRKYNRVTKQIEYVVEPIIYVFDNPQFSPGLIHVFDVDGDKDIDIILGNMDSDLNESHLVFENLENATFSEPYLLSSIYNTDDFSVPFSTIFYSSLTDYENGVEISYLFTECDNLYIINGFSTKDITNSVSPFTYNNKIYPNPTNGILNYDFDVDFDFFTVTNVAGTEVKKGNLSSNNILDLTELENGLYFLSFHREGEKLSKKIFIQK